MPVVIFRKHGEAPCAYITKQDLETRVLQVGYDETDRWGGMIIPEGERRYYVNPQPRRSVLPIGLRATRSTLL